MLIQYVLDDCITSMLPWSLIVSRQLARFASLHASLRYLCGLRVGVYPEQSRRALYSSFSSSPKPNLDRPACARNSFPLNLFADPYPLNPVVSIFYKKAGGRGNLLVSSEAPQPAQFRCNVSPFRINTYRVPTSVDSKPLTRIVSPLDATFTKITGGGVVMVNQESEKDSWPERVQRAEVSLSHGSRDTGHRARNTGTPRIMCAPLQESTSCTIASLAGPDGTSVKLVTACGDSPAGPVPTTPNRSTPCSALSISAAISLTLRGPTAKAAANRSSEKFCATTPARNSTSQRKFRPRTANGPAAAISPSMIAIRRTTSKRMSTKASPISASKNSTSSSFTLGKTAGSTTSASRAPWKSCARPAKRKPSASASIAGSRTTAFAPCSKASPTPSRSSTTSSTRIPKTRSSPFAA